MLINILCTFVCSRWIEFIASSYAFIYSFARNYFIRHICWVTIIAVIELFEQLCNCDYCVFDEWDTTMLNLKLLWLLRGECGSLTIIEVVKDTGKFYIIKLYASINHQKNLCDFYKFSLSCSYFLKRTHKILIIKSTYPIQSSEIK